MTKSSEMLFFRKDYFSILAIMPEETKNMSIIFLKHIQSYRLPLPKSTTSSTKTKCVMAITEVILTPLLRPRFLALVMSRLKPSTIIRNNRGDRGHP